MNLLHNKALVANKEVRNLEFQEATDNLIAGKEIVVELFQSVAGQLLLEYLLAVADRVKDDYFEKTTTDKFDKKYLQGQLQSIDDIVGLVYFIKSFKKI